MKTCTVDYQLLADCADTLLLLDHFSQHAVTIAAIIPHLLINNDNILITQLAGMLEQLATDAQNCEGGRLSAQLCSVLDNEIDIRH